MAATFSFCDEILLLTSTPGLLTKKKPTAKSETDFKSYKHNDVIHIYNKKSCFISIINKNKIKIRFRFHFHHFLNH